MKVLHCFHKNWFWLCHSKLRKKKVKSAIFKCSKHWFFTSSYFQNHFLNCSQWQTFPLHSVYSFALLSSKIFSSSSLKNLSKSLQKHSEHLFSTSGYLKNHFLKWSVWQTFDLNCFKGFPLPSQKNGFNFITQNFAKRPEKLLLSAWNIQFSHQGSFKVIY